MATMAQPVRALRSLVGGVPQLPRSRDSQQQRQTRSGDVKFDASSRVGVTSARAVSGKHCSSSSSGGFAHSNSPLSKHGLVGSRERRQRVLLARSGISSSPSNAHESDPGRASLVSSAESLLQSLEKKQSSVGRDNGSAIGSLPDERGISLHDDSSGSFVPESSLSDMSVVAPRVQGFGDSPFVDFAMDVTTASVSGAGDCEALAVPMYQPKWVWFAQSVEEENAFIDRAINATIVGSAATLAITKILTVDHDYWHGWTLFEILQYAPVHNWFAYEELLKTHPVLAKMMISGTVYSLGDWIAQCYEGKPVLEFNRLRMFRSGLVGFSLHGSLSHFYYHICEWLFPFQGWWVLPLKVGFDQTIWSGIWNSIYFIAVGLLRGESPTTIVKELRQTFFPLLTAGWKLWPFAHLITYGVVPVEQRLLWVDMVEIVWVTILAMYSNEKSEARIVDSEIAVGITEAPVSAVAIQEVGEDEKSTL